jgi:hypothetical protein
MKENVNPGTWACVFTLSSRVPPIRPGWTDNGLPQPPPLPLSSSSITGISRGCGGSLRQPPDGGQEWKNWYCTVIVSIFCFYHFVIGHLEAEKLTAEVLWKSVKSWWEPIFCDFLAWRAGTTRLGQLREDSAQSLSDYKRRRQHLLRRTPARSERNQLQWTLPGQNSKEMLHRTCI